VRSVPHLRSFYEDRASEKRLTSDNPEMKSLISRIKTWVDLRPNQRVLDIGCYDGYILRRLTNEAPIVGIGVDVSLRAVKRAEAGSEEARLAFAACEAGHLPFLDASFDVVLCSEILEHVVGFHAVLNEIARVLRPGGRLYATIPNSLSEVWWPLRGTCRRVDTIEGHLRRLSFEEFLSSLSQYRLVCLKARYRGFVFSAIWYRLTVYNKIARSVGSSMLDNNHRPLARVARVIVYGLMHSYMSVDGLFSRSSLCMGIDAVFERLP